MVNFMKMFIAMLICCLPLAAMAETFATWQELSQTYDPYPPPAQLPEDYFPCVLYDSNQFSGNGASYYYKMWFQGSGAPEAFDVAYSNDGVNWTAPIATDISEVGGAYHPVLVYSADGFGGGPIRYKMWFRSDVINAINGLRYSESTNGVTWTAPVACTQDAGFPLVTGVDGYFYHLYGPGCVHYNAAGTNTPGDPYSFQYVMFFDTATEGNPPIGPTNVEQIGLAYSTDGLHWTRYGTEPVFIPSGNMAAWDGNFHYRAKVFKMNQFHMYYTGSNDQIDPVTSVPYAHGIGHATSPDGIHWTPDPNNPIFIYTDGVAWRSDRTLGGCVIYNTFIDDSNQDPYNDLLKMWFNGGATLSTPPGPTAGLDQAIGAAVLPYPAIPYTAQRLITDKGFYNNQYVVKLDWSLIPLSSFYADIDQIVIYRIKGGERVLIGQVSKTTTTFEDHVKNAIIPAYQLFPTFPRGNL
jgi:hypothetical protein